MRNKFRENKDLRGEVLQITPKELSMGVNIVKLNSGKIQVFFMRSTDDKGDLKIEAKDWTLSEESEIVNGLMNVVDSNMVIDPNLYTLERELSHLVSDAGTYEITRQDLVLRMMKIRNELRTTIRAKGYEGFF